MNLLSRTVLAFWLLTVGLLMGEVQVASLHPLMGDLVRQVGGERVRVVDIAKPGFNVHTFSPTARDLKAMATCQLVVASGKNIERYLDSLRDSLGSTPILEVGRTIPSRMISGSESLYICCPNHAQGTVDPHWWHDVSNMQRAAKVVENELTRLDPAGDKYYRSRSKELRKNYKSLHRWVKAQIAALPRDQRKLVTAHAAFGYFCKTYKMKSVFVLGLSGDHEVSAKALSREVLKLQQEKIRAVFPEKNLNPKVLKQIANQAGANLGGILIADGGVSSYEAMIRHNVSTIVKGLKEPRS